VTPPTEPPRDTSQSSLDPAYYDALGRAIQVLRVERGMQRKDLAERSGVSYPYLSEIENGKKRPSSESLLAIANALGLRPSELMERAEIYRGTAPPKPSHPPFEGMAPSREWSEPVAAAAASLPAEPPAAPPLAAQMSAEDAALLRPAREEPKGRTWVRAASRRRSGGTESGSGEPRRVSRTANAPAIGGLEQLATLAARLGPDDLARLVDLARRLAR
jgi:DNA-binding XRE family transcriptional regulator